MDFFHLAPARIRRPPLSFRPLFSASAPLLLSRPPSIPVSFPPATVFFSLSSSRVRAKSTRAAAAAVCPPNYAEFISYGARHACLRPLPVTFIPAVIYERERAVVYTAPLRLPFSRDFAETLFFMRPFATCLCESTVRVGPDSELIDRRTRRIEEVARCFK